MALALACPGAGQEPAPETPPPAIPPEFPEESVKLPEVGPPTGSDEKLLDSDIPAGAVPVQEPRREEPQNLQDWLEEEISQPPPPVTEEPKEAPPFSPDTTRDVAMNQALSTGETMLGSLGGLGGMLTSPFLASAPFFPNGAGMQPLTPIRVGSLDVHVHTSLGFIGSHVSRGDAGGEYSASGLFQGGLTALMGRSGLSSLWISYDIGLTYPESASQNRQGGGGNGSGGLDQSFSLMAKVVFPELRRLEFLLGVKYASLSGLDRDTGDGSKRQIATASLSTNYKYSEKTDFSWSLSVPVRQFSDEVSSSGVNSTLFVTNQVTRKTSVGLGYTLGSLDVEDGNDQVFQQALVRATFAPTRFVLVDVTAGVDFRDQGDTFSTAPIFGLSATWDSQRGTSFALAAERRIFNAASAINTNFTSSSVVLSVGQRLGWGMLGLLSAGYEYTEYESVGTGGEGDRTDRLSYLSATLTAPITRHWSWALNFSAGKNESELEPFDYLQMTFKTSLEF